MRFLHSKISKSLFWDWNWHVPPTVLTKCVIYMYMKPLEMFFGQFQGYFVFSNFCKENYSNIDARHSAIIWNQPSIMTQALYKILIKAGPRGSIRIAFIKFKSHVRKWHIMVHEVYNSVPDMVIWFNSHTIEHISSLPGLRWLTARLSHTWQCYVLYC